MAELRPRRGRRRPPILRKRWTTTSTPRALASLHGLVGALNRVSASASASFVVSETGQAALGAARDTLQELTGVLGMDLGTGGPVSAGLTAELMQLLIDVRAEARRLNQYGLADAIRSRLTDLGIILEDRADATSWRKR